jgi:hypothetical protein
LTQAKKQTLYAEMHQDELKLLLLLQRNVEQTLAD